MKNFRVQIRYHGYYADFNISAEDTAIGIEKSILDKLGKNEVKFDTDEVINDGRPIQYEEVLGVRMSTGTSEGRQA